MPAIQTTMAEAFAAAGYQPPEPPDEALHRLMADAIKSGSSPLPGPASERFAAMLRDAEDFDLVWELFAAHRDAVVLKLYHAVLGEVRAGKDFGRGDQRDREIHMESVDTPEGGAAGETGATMKTKVGLSQPAVAATNTGSNVTTISPHRPPGGGVSGMQEVLRWERQSWLQRFTVANKAVANMTLPELEKAIADRGHHYRWLMLIRDSWPAHTTSGTVLDHVSEEDGDRLYERAREMANA